jgi:hypothetical protein
MMDVVNMDTSPTSGDVLKSCAFYQSLCIHTSFYAPITNLLGVTIIFEYFTFDMQIFAVFEFFFSIS